MVVEPCHSHCIYLFQPQTHGEAPGLRFLGIQGGGIKLGVCEHPRGLLWGCFRAGVDRKRGIVLLNL